jgi:hypothetical protein
MSEFVLVGQRRTGGSGWTASPTMAGMAEIPTWAALLVDDAAPDLVTLPSDVEGFVEHALALPWFTRVGRPSAWDDRCVRLAGWDNWPGPESEEGALFYDDQRWVDAVLDAGGRSDWERIRRSVVEVAQAAVPKSEDDDDPYDPRNTCLAHAGVIAATIACFRGLGWPVPTDLHARWAWFAAGRWPCGYAYETPAHTPPYRLLVL